MILFHPEDVKYLCILYNGKVIFITKKFLYDKDIDTKKFFIKDDEILLAVFYKDNEMELFSISKEII